MTDDDVESLAESGRLAEYLRARRGLVTPEQAGIPRSVRRRVAGLRREEVAMLAGISSDYYLRLERGRDRNPSPQVLEALARVLQLDDVERDYLRGLVEGQVGPPRRRTPASERVPARLRHLLGAIGLPAFIEGRTFDVLAANDLARALNPRLRPGQNRMRSLLLDPEEHAFQRDWERHAAGFIAAFRQQIGDDVSDSRVLELVGELSVASGRFRELWARHDVRMLDGGDVVVVHPVVGELTLHREKMPVERVMFVVYYADANSESAEKLQLLSALRGS